MKTVSAVEKKKVEVSAAVIIRDGEVLLTSRDDHGGRHWEFPGGKREPGESFAECLRRELREELGIEVMVFDVMYCIEHEYPARIVNIRFLRSILLDSHAEIIPREGQECRWMPLSQLDNIELLPADAPLADFLRLTSEILPNADNKRTAGSVIML